MQLRGKIIAGILILLGFASCILGMERMAADTGGLTADGMFYIYPNGNAAGFSYQELHTMSDDATVAFEQFKNVAVETVSETESAYVSAVYTNATYSNMINIDITDGTFLTDLSSMEPVAVLSENLAWRLFGDLKASGSTVIINNTQYQVIGVAHVENDSGEVWMSASSDEPGNDYADSLYIKPNDAYDKINSYRHCQELLTAVGKNPQDYKIVDMNEYMLSVSRRPALALSAFGLIAAIWFIVRAIYLIKPLKRTAVIKEKARLRKIVSYMAVYVIIPVAILPFLTFNIWVAGFDGGGMRQLFTALTNQGLLQSNSFISDTLLALNQLNLTSNAWFATSMAFLIASIVVLIKWRKAVLCKWR